AHTYFARKQIVQWPPILPIQCVSSRYLAGAKGRSSSNMQAYAHASFLCLCHDLFSKSLLGQKAAGPPSHKNSNNPLAVEPETENDAARESCSAKLCRVITSKRRLPAKIEKGIIENVRHVEA